MLCYVSCSFSLLWGAQVPSEPYIPDVLNSLIHCGDKRSGPKVQRRCCWLLERVRDVRFALFLCVLVLVYSAGIDTSTLHVREINSSVYLVTTVLLSTSALTPDGGLINGLKHCHRGNALKPWNQWISNFNWVDRKFLLYILTVVKSSLQRLCRVLMNTFLSYWDNKEALTGILICDALLRSAAKDYQINLHH